MSVKRIGSFSMHEIYGDFQGKKVDRDEVEPKYFESWMQWAKEKGMKLDFNSTSFSHPKSGNLTLANPDDGIRNFWIEHTKRCRWISEEMGKYQNDPCIMNLWIHGWASGPTSWLSEYVLGVQMVEPGCKVVSITPHLGDLEWVEGTFPTPYGVITIRHEKGTDGKIKSIIHASPYMEKYVLEALFDMNEPAFALERMKNRYAEMMGYKDYSTLFEGWETVGGTINHEGLYFLDQR